MDWRVSAHHDSNPGGGVSQKFALKLVKMKRKTGTRGRKTTLPGWWGRELGRVTNLRRWTAACKTLTSPAWEREGNRWCPTGNVTASIGCSFQESSIPAFKYPVLAPRLRLKCVVLGNLEYGKMHNVRFAEFYMWDFPLLPHIRHASWKVTMELVFVTQF